MNLTWETLFILWNVYLLGFLSPLMMDLHNLEKQSKRLYERDTSKGNKPIQS